MCLLEFPRRRALCSQRFLHQRASRRPDAGAALGRWPGLCGHPPLPPPRWCWGRCRDLACQPPGSPGKWRCSQRTERCDLSMLVPRGSGPVRHQKIPYINGGKLLPLFFSCFFFFAILFFCGCCSAVRQTVGQERGSSVRGGPGHGRVRGLTDAARLSVHYGNLSPSPARLEVGRLRHEGGGLQPPHK